MELPKNGKRYEFPEWEMSKKSWTEFAIVGQEVSVTIYEYFRDCVPPIFKPRGFLVSEPYGIDRRGVATYMAFVEGIGSDTGKFFYVGIITKESFNKRYTVR